MPPDGALSATEVTPDRATTDGHDAYPNAIKNEWGDSVKHRNNRYLNNYTEQSHRNLKQRYYAMRGLGNFYSAYREGNNMSVKRLKEPSIWLVFKTWNLS
ncbi:MAG: DDE-type integrase/transposase/recombinase [Candidatus Margulisbacteria bacterium]|nr:DDE-type integrase/transposase/recombinase [Candidatus Margulisiibacteriota bacterium]